MDDDWGYARSSRFAPRPSAHPAPIRREEQQYKHASYTQQRSYPAQQSYREEAHAYRSAPRDYTVSTIRSPPVDVAGPSRPLTIYRPAAPTTLTTPIANPGLPSRSEWLFLPSVSHALGIYNASRSEPRFSLVIRQQPRRGLAIGNSQMSLRTARSVPIDPPPVCELLIDRSGDEQLLSLPEVFIRAQLVRGDSTQEECLPDARRIEPLVGDTLQSPFNSRIDTREDQSFFVFKELGVRNRGVYRLRFDLFDRVGLRVFKIASVFSDVFEVQERRKHPGLSASSGLMDALVDRGMKYKLRKANDKANPKKRKSPEDFYYGDQRSRGTSCAEGQLAGPPVDHRAESGEKMLVGGEGMREMLPPLRAGLKASPTPQAPQLPSLRMGQRYPQLGLSPSPLPPHPQLRYDEGYNGRLSPMGDQLWNPIPPLRSLPPRSPPSSSSEGTYSFGNSITNPDQPSTMGLGIQNKISESASPASASSSSSSSSTTTSTSSLGSNTLKPTLPPISSFYSQQRRPSSY